MRGPVQLLLVAGAVVFLLTPPELQAQGIRSVTRRTTTLERQQPAQFLDAAGVGGAVAAGPNANPAVQTRPYPQPLILATPSYRPAVTLQGGPMMAGTSSALPGTHTNAPRAAAATKPASRRNTPP